LKIKKKRGRNRWIKRNAGGIVKEEWLWQPHATAADGSKEKRTTVRSIRTLWEQGFSTPNYKY